jgi:hypothetical protein
MFGLVAAILVAAVPAWMFDRTMLNANLPAALSFAGPPFGLVARAFASTMAFIIVGGALWIVLAPIDKLIYNRQADWGRTNRTPWRDEGYLVIDPPILLEGRRRPIFAPDELGAPLMSDEAIATPFYPVFEPEPELEASLTASEFDLPLSDTADEDDNSIQGLIRRLESGLARRAANDPGPDSPTMAPLPLSRDWIVHDNPEVSDDDDSTDVRQFLGSLRKLATR